MALSADDRLLGEKVHYYCSSSEDEGENEEKGGSQSAGPKFIPEAQMKDYTSNTGPKGVIEDWRRFKQLETEKKEEQELERLELAKKLSLTCRTYAKDEEEKEKDAAFMQQLEQQFDEFEEEFLKEYRQKRIEELRCTLETLLDAKDEEEKEKDAAFMQQLEQQFDEFEEEFLKEYRQKRIEELRCTLETLPRFGKVVDLTKEMFVEAVDSENRLVPVIVHIYEKGAPGCDTMNRCLDTLATEHLSAKFCRIRASQVQMNINFAISGLPALLVYRNGELIGNFVKLSDELGDDFHPSDVEGFLVENGMLSEETVKSNVVIRNSAAYQHESDSD